MRKYVLDTNCYIDASRDVDERTSLAEFTSWAAPGLYLSSVVAAELRTGTGSAPDRKKLEKEVLGPFIRRRRILVPSAAAWDALGLTLATLHGGQGLDPFAIRRSFAFDILLAFSCRENGMTLVTRNEKDMVRISQVFQFDHVLPYPEAPQT